MYISTKSREINFTIDLEEKVLSIKIIEFFKYLHQKFKFTRDLEKLCINVSGDAIEEESLDLFLKIQKHINKFCLYKKFTPINNSTGDASSFLIKIEFDDAIYIITQINIENIELRQLNYFGIFSFTKNYSNKDIMRFFLSENKCEYDHLLPSFVQNKNYSRVFEYLSQYIESFGVDNIKLPPIVIQGNKNENFSKLKNTI